MKELTFEQIQGVSGGDKSDDIIRSVIITTIVTNPILLGGTVGLAVGTILVGAIAK